MLRDTQQSMCGVYACVVEKGIKSCDECEESPCALRRVVQTICPLRSRFENKRWWAGRLSRALEGRRGRNASSDGGRISEKVVNRLRWYLTALESFAAENHESVSSWQLAEKVGVNAALIRKDLSRFGDFGTPSLGYRVSFLCGKIEEILGLKKERGVVWVGARCLQFHESSIDGLMKHGCSLLAVFDIDPEQIGLEIRGKTVLSVDELPEVAFGKDIDAAVVAVGGSEAQRVAESLADMGAKAILNLSGEMLVLPDRVRVSSFNIVGELLELCYYCGAK